MASSLIALVYVGRVLEVAWLREPSPQTAEVGDPPLSMLLPLVVLAAATIYFGFDTEWTAGIAGQGVGKPARRAAMSSERPEPSSRAARAVRGAPSSSRFSAAAPTCARP